MKIYLDNCCFNRPFDDQAQVRIRREAEAVLAIQDAIRAGSHSLVWSYILDYENQQNPVLERRVVISLWRAHAQQDVQSGPAILKYAIAMHELGFGKLDSLHLACAQQAGVDCFLTTDDRMLKKANRVSAFVILDPINFVNEAFHAH